jgi:hypothetical protein
MLAPLRIERVNFDDRWVAPERCSDAAQFVNAQRKTGYRGLRAELVVAESVDLKTAKRAMQGRRTVESAAR